MKKEAKKEESVIKKIISGIFLALNIILGVLVLIMALMAFFAYSAYLSGVLYFLLAIFLFFPRRILIIPNWLKFLIAMVIFTAILFINVLLYWPGAPQILTHNLREEFILDSATDVSIIVYNTTRENSILVNGQEKTSIGYFLLINSAITNLGNSAITINPSYDLTDSQNKTYAGIGFSGNQENFQPGLKKTAYFVFEIPSTINGIKFRIRDDKSIHIVSLGI